jgi:hypothetical protein
MLSKGIILSKVMITPPIISCIAMTEALRPSMVERMLIEQIWHSNLKVDSFKLILR